MKVEQETANIIKRENKTYCHKNFPGLTTGLCALKGAPVITINLYRLEIK